MGIGDAVQLLGALGLGSAGGWVSGGVSAVWKAKHDKAARLEESRRNRIARWREELTKPENQEVATASLSSYQELVHKLDASTKKAVEEGVIGPFGRVEFQIINGITYADVRVHNQLLRLVAEMERDWQLI